MKRTCSIIVTLALAVILGTGNPDTVKKAPQPQAPNANRAQPQKPVQAPQPGANRNDREPWPRTFVPSEKITADSVVSFPADI